MLLKIQLEQNTQGAVTMKKTAQEIARVSYKSLGMKEDALEEFLHHNIDVLTKEEDYQLMIVAKQVINSANKRTDLVALDSNGNLVVIEIKRDLEDMRARKDNFESQAIRYASSFTKFEEIPAFVRHVYAPYLIRYEQIPAASAQAEGETRILDFLTTHGNPDLFNIDQRIMLIASSFDQSTLSSAVWLRSRGVDIECIEIAPQVIETAQGEEHMLYLSKLLPLGSEKDYYTDITANEKTASTRRRSFKRTTRPRLIHMIEKEVVAEGDEIFFRGRESDSAALIYGENNVEFEGKVLTLNNWATRFTQGTNVNAYDYAVVRRTGKTLSELRIENNDLFMAMGFGSLAD